MLNWLKRRKFNFALIFCGLVASSLFFAWVHSKFDSLAASTTLWLFTGSISALCAFISSLATCGEEGEEGYAGKLVIVNRWAAGQFLSVCALCAAYYDWDVAKFFGVFASVFFLRCILYASKAIDAAPEISHESAVRIRVAELEREIEPGLKKLTEERVRLAEIEQKRGYR